MPKLFQINVVANWGSTGRIAEGIGEAAMRQGWRSYIAYGRGTPQSQSELIRIGNKWDMCHNAMVARLLDNEGLNAQQATRRLIAQMEEISPDIIHLHNIHGYYLNYPLLFSYLASTDIPVIWTLHDCWPFTGHCTYFDFVGCDKWTAGCKHCPQLRTYPASIGILDRSKRNYEMKSRYFSMPQKLTLVPVSDWLADLVRLSMLKEFEIRRIYNGVDIQTFRIKDNGDDVRHRLGIGTRKMLIGVASIWDERKGLNDFVKLRNELHEDDYTIVLVGLDKQQIKSIPQGITGIMRTDSIEELADYYSAADVFVNPTWEDNFPTTNIESLACGTPVITYRTGGSPEAIDKQTGIVVEKGDIEGLASAVRTVIHNGKDYYANKCRQRAERIFNKTDRFAEYVGLYERILNECKQTLIRGGKSLTHSLTSSYAEDNRAERRAA